MRINKPTDENTPRDTSRELPLGVLAGIRKRCRAAWVRIAARLARWLTRRLRATGRRPDLQLQRLTLDKEMANRNSGEVERLLKSLEGHPFQRQLILVRELKGFEMAFVVRELCKASREALWESAARARELGLLAADIAERLNSRHYPEGFVNDLRGLAWVRIGHAERRASNLIGSEEALAEAVGYLEAGSGDWGEQAEFFHVLGLLRVDQGRPREALRYTEYAARLYEKMSDWHLLGKVTLDQGVILADEGDLEGACKKVISSSFLINKGREPRLVLAVVHNLSLYLAKLGKPKAALAVLREGLPLYQVVGTRSQILKQYWLEGTILAQLGWPAWREAAAKFRKAREGFLEEGNVIDAARVTLEEALISDPEERTSLVGRLLTEMMPALRARGLRQEALAALALLGEGLRGQVGESAIRTAIRTLGRERLESGRAGRNPPAGSRGPG